MKTKSTSTSRNILILPVVALLVTGCSKDMSDLTTFIAVTKTSGVGKVEEIPQFKPYESFAYSASELRDPFIANANIDEDSSEEKNALHPTAARPKQHLENFPLDTLSMVGTMEQTENSWGLIKDPQNLVHRVQLDNYLGQSEGRIVKITETKIYLIETVPDGIGGYIEREASIAIGNE